MEIFLKVRFKLSPSYGFLIVVNFFTEKWFSYYVSIILLKKIRKSQIDNALLFCGAVGYIIHICCDIGNSDLQNVGGSQRSAHGCISPETDHSS